MREGCSRARYHDSCFEISQWDSPIASGITVADVAGRLGSSTRLLELRFREILGHGVKEEMLRIRLENVRHLLAKMRK